MQTDLVELEHSAVRLIEALTDGKLRAISFDLEIQADKLKYSGWLSALATAGIALLITNFEKVTPPFRALGSLALVGPVVAALFLIASLVMGGFLHWILNKGFERKRQEMTLYMKQKCLLYSGDVVIGKDDDVSMKIKTGAYLNQQNQEFLADLDKQDENQPNEERMLLVQGALVIIGFLTAFIGAIRVPAG